VVPVATRGRAPDSSRDRPATTGAPTQLPLLWPSLASRLAGAARQGRSRSLLGRVAPSPPLL
jgi:hypothetical protein